MDSMIKQMNDSLRVIIDNLKGDVDTLNNTLENIQFQMDKKVEEAKKYKIEVDSSKSKILDLEQDNKDLELSLSELSDKYGKLNLVSIIETGNREIKAKINDNIKEINKCKERIAELTNRARTIKDLLINLKKDKSIKEDRVKSLNEVYNYYDERISEIMDFAHDHANNLSDYKYTIKHGNDYSIEDEETEVDNSELENTMVFDEIASIDHNKNFKDEMSFISNQIDDSINENKEEESNELDSSFDEKDNFDIENENNIISDPVLDDNDNTINKDDTNNINILEDNGDDDDADNTNEPFIFDNKPVDDITLDDTDNESESALLENNNVISDDVEPKTDEIQSDDLNNIGTIPSIDDLKDNKVKDNDNVEKFDIDETRVNKLNDLFSVMDTTTINKPVEPVINDQGVPPISTIPNTINSIDDAYLESFGKPIEEKVSTLTDIFGNSFKEEEINKNSSVITIENLFIENGLDFNKFKDDERDYLKQIYKEDKFRNIFNTLKNNKINLDNIYNAFNIFGEMTPQELESVIGKLLNAGQSSMTIGFILEKLPKVKKYDLDNAIISYGDGVKDINITELIMKAKKMYENGGNI